MAWTPTKNIVDTRFIGKNVLDFIKTNDAEALAWANGDAPLKEFQQFSESVANRFQPVFPSLAIVDDGNATDFDSDLLTTGYEITLEAMIYGADAVEVPRTAKKYAYALESMLANMTAAALLADTTLKMKVNLSGIETQYDELKSNEMQNAFMQMFQTKAIYQFYAAAY